MKILLFDMDGVLLDPQGYHRALQETIRLVSLSLGFDAYHLQPSAIARFEALGISNEFHSSAISMAMMGIEAQKQGLPFTPSIHVQTKSNNPETLQLDFGRMLECIESQPIDLPALARCQAALKEYAEQVDVDASPFMGIVQQCESIENSLTFNVFQELVLGSQEFESTYGIESQLDQGSYLSRFDRSFVDESLQATLKTWSTLPQQCAAIMTNRPSNTLLGLPGTPEAELGAELVGLDFLPIIGFGEMTWLANQIGDEVSNLQKPAVPHALSAILAATGMPVEAALLEAQKIVVGQCDLDLSFLDGSEISVFEDTPAGIVAVENSQRFFGANGLGIDIQKYGIAPDVIKANALEELGAQIYDSVGAALDILL